MSEADSPAADMSVRTFMAALVMAGLLASQDLTDPAPEAVAKGALDYADALLAELHSRRLPF